MSTIPRIQHNIAAMNAYRNYSANSKRLTSNLEKLSSGYRINRAGDDAAGLAISEKMRAQISGLTQAKKNATDGISLIQTAEGALTEVHDMLNRMVTLTEQSANGTYDDSVDRVQLQKEVDSLKEEINRIADSTNYNGIKLLDGSLDKAESTKFETQLSTIKNAGNGGVLTSQQYVDAKGKSVTIGIDKTSGAKGIKPAAGTYEAFTIDFTGKDGKSYTLNLLENDKDAISATSDATYASALVSALSGADGNLGFVTSGDGQDEALKMFHETFDFTTGQVPGGNAGDAVTITTKDPNGTGSINSLKFNTDADVHTAFTGMTSVGLNDGVKTVSKGATPAGIELTLAPANGFSASSNAALTIGGKTYQYVAAGEQATIAGAKAVAKESSATSFSNLVAALKEDGIEAVDAGSGKVIIDGSTIQESQAGGQVSTNTDKLAIANQEATKQKMVTTVAAGSGSAQNLTVNYIDANGEAKTKTLAYTSDAAAATNATAISDALRNDDDLSELFNVTLDTSGTNPTVTIEAKGTDPRVGQFTNIQTDDATNGLTNVYTPGTGDGKTLEIKKGAANDNFENGNTVTVNGKTYEFATDTNQEIGKGNTRVLIGASGTDSMKNLSKAMTKDGVINSFDEASGKITMLDSENKPEVKGGLTLQIGDTSDDFNKLTVGVKDMHVDSMGIGDVDISTQEGAAAAMDKIKAAVNYVSDVRGGLGALQNRLDHTINNLGVMHENIQAAEGAIRDTDVAEEMMAYTKNNILNQAAQAMLAQANQLPQGVLQLLG